MSGGDVDWKTRAQIIIINTIIKKRSICTKLIIHIPPSLNAFMVATISSLIERTAAAISICASAP